MAETATLSYDTEKADEMTLALLYLTSFQEPHGPLLAWKGMDWDIMNRLYEKLAGLGTLV
jgi:hypothetical protein